MIKLSFAIGGAFRRVVIKERKIAMLSQETGFVPISFDLDKLEDSGMWKELSKEQKELLEEIKKLETEEDMAKDITKDFQRTGWRLIKKE